MTNYAGHKDRKWWKKGRGIFDLFYIKDYIEGITEDKKIRLSWRSHIIKVVAVIIVVKLMILFWGGKGLLIYPRIRPKIIILLISQN